MTLSHQTASGSLSASFRVGFSADFCGEDGQLAFPEIGLSLLANIPGLSYEFLSEYRSEYTPGQLAPFDVVISLKPRVTAQSLEGIWRI